MTSDTAVAQYRGPVDHYRPGYVEPGWNRQGSAVCPQGYDFDRGWCKPRGGYYRDGGYGGGYGGYGGSYGGSYGRRSYGGGDYGEAIPPRWRYDGSAVCPNNYDFVHNACRPRSIYRLPPRWNAQGSAVCPTGYDFRGGWCRPQR